MPGAVTGWWQCARQSCSCLFGFVVVLLLWGGEWLTVRGDTVYDGTEVTVEAAGIWGVSACSHLNRSESKWGKRKEEGGGGEGEDFFLFKFCLGPQPIDLCPPYSGHSLPT